MKAFIFLALIGLIFCETKQENLILNKPFPLKNQTIQKQATSTSSLCYCGDFKVNCDLKSVCSSDCKKELRYASEVDCVFPFQYKGVWYDTCTDVDRTGGVLWCSIDKVFNYRYAECEQKCPLLARNLVKKTENAVHTSCREAGSGWEAIFPTDSEVQIILDTHNNERKIVDPPASDMKILTWDFDLARIALNLAMTGEFAHDCGDCRRLINKRDIYNGQNLYMSGGIAYSTETTWSSAINAWINEKKDWEYGTGSTNGGVVGHYTQVVYSGSVRVGCAAAMNQGLKKIIAACNYASGQMSFEKPYETGTPCTDCSNCSDSKICGCNKLCQYGGTLDTNTCTCSCPAYAIGEQCETLVCDKTDKDYGCWGPGDTKYCTYSNTAPMCPFTCGVCSYV